VFAWQSILPQEILVVRHEQKTSGTSVDFGVRGVSAKATLSLLLSNLPKAGKAV
jgi:hypothetical protein